MKKTIVIVVLASALTSCLVQAQNARSLFINKSNVNFTTEIKIDEPYQPEETTTKTVEIIKSEKVVTTEKVTKPSAIVDPKRRELAGKKDFHPEKVEITKLSKKQQGPEKADYAGISYSIFKEVGPENFAKVTPSQVFETGDRIYVEVTTNKTGKLISGNIDPENAATVLSVEPIHAHKPLRIPQRGALQFVGPKGNEKLVFILSNEDVVVTTTNAKHYINECKSKTKTRSIVVDDSVGNKYQLINKDGSCPVKSESKGSTRSIIVVVEDDSSYGVVESEALASGQLLSLIVNLKHN